MTSPEFVADFDSATGLAKALAAALHGERFRRLGQGHLQGLLARSTTLLPKPLRVTAYSVAGAMESLPQDRFSTVSADRFARWVTSLYPPGPVPALAIGSSDGAVMHLCAAMAAPWLPQTFLVPVARRADPDDVDIDVELGRRLGPQLLDHEPLLQIHQMHDPNQDRLMVKRMAYFRQKLRRLPDAYRDYITSALPSGGTLLVVDDTLRWPAHRIGERHLLQAGAFGGLRAQEYTSGSERVAAFLADQGAAERSWSYPPSDVEAPEAEWGFEASLYDDLVALAAERGYRIVRLVLSGPEAAGHAIAETYRRWYDSLGTPARGVLAETFVCVDPHWVLATRTVPLWLPFPVESSAQCLAEHLEHSPPYRNVAATLFAHGVESAGLAPVQTWRGLTDELLGVSTGRWPADFASFARYSPALSRLSRAQHPPVRLAVDDAEALTTEAGLPWEDVA